MSLAEAHAAVVASAIERSNYVRGPRPFGDVYGHKEWFHFSVSAPALDLVINFSVFQEPDGPIGRLILLVRGPRVEAGWRGHLQEVAGADVQARPGGHVLGLGASFARFHQGAYEVSARLPEAGIAVDLRLRPLTIPGQANNSPLPRGGVLHWLFVPRLRATGALEIGGQRWPIEEALAYHDHNWGHFRWGGDFAWEWGYALPPADSPWSLVFVRLSDRGHTTDLSRSLFLWDGARQVRLFRDDEIEVRHEGLLRPGRVLRLPGIMRLLLPGEACEVPRRVHLDAHSGEDHLQVVYQAESVAQIGVPHDGDSGATLINEVAGTVEVAGRVAGRSLDWRGRAFFEFLDG